MGRGLSSLTLDQLQIFLLNAVRGLKDRPVEAHRIIEKVVKEMLARRELAPEFTPVLSLLGYNVRWKKWTSKDRQTFLQWLIHADLGSAGDAIVPGPGIERARYIYRTIRSWMRRYGEQIHMVDAAARWQSDMTFLEQLGQQGFDTP